MEKNVKTMLRTEIVCKKIPFEKFIEFGVPLNNSLQTISRIIFIPRPLAQ